MSKQLLKLWLFMVAAAGLQAQDVGDLPRDSKEAFALTGVHIHTGAGDEISDGVIIVRHGLIEAVGRGVDIPADARRLDLSGMHVYPGLIDALSGKGLRRETPPPGRGGGQGQGQGRGGGANRSDPNDPEAEGPGLFPHRRAGDMLDKDLGTALSSWRENGVLTVHVAPEKGIFRGQTAVVNAGQGEADALIVRSPVAMALNYSGMSGRVYPSSLMGMISHIRQTLFDAHHYGEAARIYSASPRGLRRPEVDRGLESIQPVVQGEMPLIFPGNRAREIRRALAIAQEHGVKAMIAGGFEADQVVDALRQHNVPVLFSLDLPKKPENAHPEAQESLATLRYRVDAPKVPSRLKDAGVPFAFTAGTSPKDYRDGLRRVVEAGLSKQDALRAASLGAAEILGVDQSLGSIESGKIANLVVADKDLFENGSAVRHVFVDGRKYDVPVKESRPREGGGSGAPVDLSGSWDVTVQTPNGSQSLQFDLNAEEGTIRGQVISDRLGTLEIEEGTVDGDSFSFSIEADVGSGPVAITFSGRVEGDDISGDANVSGMGAAPFRGSRTP